MCMLAVKASAIARLWWRTRVRAHFTELCYWCNLVSFPDPPSGGCGKREEGLGDNPGWKCPEGRNSTTGYLDGIQY